MKEDAIGIAHAKHGRFKFFTRDEWIGRSLFTLGEWSEDEVSAFQKILQKNDIALDVGANIGAFTVPMSRLCKTVYAFEPHPDTCALLRENLEVNGCDNVKVINAAASDKEGTAFMPPVDGMLNPAGFSVSEKGGSEDVAIKTVTIDSLKLERLDFLKCDAEGHELQVLKGAKETIKKFRPILYLENDRSDKSVDLVAYVIGELQYRCYWHRIPLFNPKNFKGETVNIYGDTISLMILCVPEEKPEIKVARLDEVADIRMDDATYKREIERYERILARTPDDLDTRVIVAHYYNLMQQGDKAFALLEENLKIDPDHFGTLAIRGLLRLQRKQWEQGWQDYELRYRKENSQLFGNRPHYSPHWDGQPTDKRLLIWCEQGFGDSIMYARFMTDVLKIAPNAFLEIQPQLFELFEQSNISPMGLYRKGRTLPEYDLHCSLPSLPATLRLGGDLRRPVPYLFPEKRMQQSWHERTAFPKIGLCYKGNMRSERCYSRDIEYKMFDAIIRKYPVLSLLDQGQWESYADTAAAISELELVITVDTSIAHLAGAMGKRTWLLLSFDPDFRWGLDSEECVWYPTMKIFRQPNLFDWQSVIDRICTEVDTLNIGRVADVKRPEAGASGSRQADAETAHAAGA